MNTLAEIPKLEDWAVVILNHNVSPYLAPELIVQGLHGEVFGSPKFTDGDSVTTSAIQGKRTVDGETVVVTKSGSLYKLGTISSDYESNYPNARDRFVNSLPEV